uniref:Uncharacterized protein n=1 Tax=Parascaris equorum TaxID=6256 RepID=A0A914RRL9_PAREQ
MSGMPEKEPRPLLVLDILNLGISSTIANRITLMLIKVIIPSLNFASLKISLCNSNTNCK